MPVHTALVPDVSVFATKGLENINPAMNGGNNNGSRRERERENVNPLAGKGGALGGFDGFADLNPFTMKTLDAYVFFLLLLSSFFVPLNFSLGWNCDSTPHASLFPFFFFDLFSCFLWELPWGFLRLSLLFLLPLCDPLPITISPHRVTS